MSTWLFLEVTVYFFSYITHQDPAIIKNDPSFIEMQLFYGELAKIARELVKSKKTRCNNSSILGIHSSSPTPIRCYSSFTNPTASNL